MSKSFGFIHETKASQKACINAKPEMADKTTLSSQCSAGSRPAAGHGDEESVCKGTGRTYDKGKLGFTTRMRFWKLGTAHKLQSLWEAAKVKLERAIEDGDSSV